MTVMHKLLKDQIIVLTGASSGIGLATARLAAERGAKLVLVSRSANTLDHLRDEMVSAGGEAIQLPPMSRIAPKCFSWRKKRCAITAASIPG